MNADSQKMARRSGLLGWLARAGAARLLSIAMLTLLGAIAQPAGAEAVDYTRFNHMTTGFPLDGQHLNLRCEQCHLNGIFEGTPRQCSQCHVQGNPRSAVFMPVNHIPTPLPCDSCHTTNAFQGTHFAHSNVMPGTCEQCHNGVNAVGKNKGHIVTSQPCDQCHTTISFSSAFTTFPTGHIPTNQACAVCHSAGYSPLLTKMVHAGISSGCTTCHAADAPATAPLTFTLQTTLVAGTTPLTEQVTPTSQNYHPPTSSSPTHFRISESCEVCHSIPSAPMAPTAQAGGFAGGKMNHAGITSGCASCHADGNGPFIGVTTLVTMSSKGTHIPINGAACEKCHDPSSTSTGGFKITATPQLSATGHAAVSAVACATCHGTGVSFFDVSNLVTQLANHMPIAGAACTACHASNFVTGGFKITGSPVLSVAGHAAVASLTCNTCHENNATDLGFQGVLTQIFVRPGAVAVGLSPVDAAHATGTLAAPNDCAQCHNTTPPFKANQLPSAHIPLPSSGAGSQCATCHSAGYSPTLSKMVHSVVTSESCTTCHGAGKGPFSGSGPGTGGQPVMPPGALGASGAGNHIPVGSADCVACHASTDTESGTGFRLSGTPSLSAAGHTAVNALTCATCHSSGMAWFLNGATLVVPAGTVGTPGAANHIALGTGDCKTCHATNIAVGGFKITTTPSLAAAGHAAVSGQTCDSCHAAANATWNIVTTVAPAANHIPTGTAVCSGCHASNFTTGGFKITSSPVLSAAGHTAVSSVTCNTCHETSSINAATINWQGVGALIYLRPGATKGPDLSPADAAHATGNLAAPNDCATCHSTSPPFSNTSTLPSNHMPLPTTGAPACAVCHAAGYAVGKSIMVHSAVTAESCTTCHGAGKGPFSGSSQGTGGQPKQPPGTVGTAGATNHIPVGSADCGTTCHASADAMTGTGFKVAATPVLSAAGHTSVVSSVTCASCHGAGKNVWFGVTIKAPPGTVGTSGAANHIPIPASDGCNTCHANTNYVSFAGTTMNHAGISTGCSSCHNAAMAWYGVTIKTNTLAPAHIPVAATPVCEACHSPTNFTAFGPGTAMNPTTHLQVPTSLEACTTCHENGDATKFYGVTIVTRPTTTADPSHPTTGDCGGSGCHTTTPPFSGSTKPTNHIPSSATCTACHTGYTPATTMMNHSDSGVGTAGSPVACATCHGYTAGPYYGTAQGQAGGQPLKPPGTSAGAASAAQHLPFGSTACNVCHASTTVPGGFKGTTVPHTNGPFMTYTRGNGKSNSGSSTPKCVTCHAPGGAKWYGANFSTATMGSHHGSTTTADCVDCHSPQGGFAAAAAAAAAKAKPRPTGGPAVRPPATPVTPPAKGPIPRAAAGTPTLPASGPFSHAGVTPGSCASCHRPGGGASTTPGGHLPTTLSCDACHRTTAWMPVSYAHAGVGPGHCASCHAAAGKWATPKPARHFLTARSCDVCHHSTSSWLPVMYDHLSPRYRPQTGIVRCIDCHTTNTEMVVPGPSTPAGRRAMPGGPTRHP